MKKSTLLLLILAIVCILSLASCGKKTNNTTDSTASTTASAKPTENTDKPLVTGTAQTVEPTLAPTDSTVEPTKVPTQEPTKEPTKEPTVAPTTAPTSKPTENAQPTADPAIYNDNWGYSMDNSNTIRSNGQELFWTKTRHLVKIPEQLHNRGVYLIDSENEQAFITTGFFGEDLTYYALRDGVFYKLNQGKIVKWNTYMDTYVWVEEDGTACSIGFRSKYWNEVYIEGKECKSIAYRSSTGKFVVVKQSGEIMDVNTEAVLRTATVLN